MSHNCYHCGDKIPPGEDILLHEDRVAGKAQTEKVLRFCCHGCKAVYQTICAGGFSQYYEQRTELARSQRPINSAGHKNDLEHLGHWQTHELEQTFAGALEKKLDYVSIDNRASNEVSNNKNQVQANFCVEGMHCSACAWLIESALVDLAGVSDVCVSLFNQKLTIKLDGKLTFDTVIRRLAELGYRILPWSEDARVETIHREKQGYQRRMGVAGLIMMQVGMLALAMYLSGGASVQGGMSFETLLLLRVASAILSTIAIVYCASPIFKSAWSAIRQLHLNMDVPITIALLSAYGMSVAATIFNWHEVYFDTVAMFVFFVLLSRFFELATRSRVALANQQNLPQTCLKQNGFDDKGQPVLEAVSVSELCKGEVILVEANAVIAADGYLKDILHSEAAFENGHANSDFANNDSSTNGRCLINESIFSGESEPAKKKKGSRIYAGTQNAAYSFWLEVNAPARESRIAQLTQLAEQAKTRKPLFLQQIDRVVPWFIGGVLLLAACSFAYWLMSLQTDTNGNYYATLLPAWKIALSVLVVSCPCALALATPMGHALGNLAARKLGVTTFSENLLLRLANITDVIFDKTGTLTKISATEVDLQWVNKKLLSSEKLACLIYLIEHDIDHPIAGALQDFAERIIHQSGRDAAAWIDHYQLGEQTSVHGCGVETVIDGVTYRLGKPDWAIAIISDNGNSRDDYLEAGTPRSLLCSEKACLASFDFGEVLSEGAAELSNSLQQRDLALHLVSGDRCEKTEAIARQLGIDSVKADCLPEDKLNYLQALQAKGKQVLVIGDGVNDTLVFSAADASIAVLGSSSVSQLQADAALTTKSLMPLQNLLLLSHSTRHIVRQNIGWAISYNSISLPLAALGVLPAWGAALGMSLSSLLVVANAHRLIITRAHSINSGDGMDKEFGECDTDNSGFNKQPLVQAGAR